ncbi:MAG: DUF2974 domain-containing protein [Clostridia bacterium]|nr:DUF2974 domain-containing protein [Clostridia bacterium]
MTNMMDYLAWRGDVPFSASPWNETDALIIAVVSYLNFDGVDNERGMTFRELKECGALRPGNGGSFAARRALFEAAAETERFGGCRIHYFFALTDEALKTQFSAMCVDVGDGTVCVAYRGTDNTIIGWREDFNMMCRCPVPAQEAAVLYLENACRNIRMPVRITGHSKGGNLAVYAAACAAPETRDRVLDVWTYDGPGMAKIVFDSVGYREAAPKIRAFVPQTSIFGMLMCHPETYTVVVSDASGLAQHDPFTWKVTGSRFGTAEEIDSTARVIDETLHEWLAGSTLEQREVFVETLFRLMGSTQAITLSELRGDRMKNMAKMLAASLDIDPETRRVITRLFGQFLTLGVGNVVERVIENVGDRNGDKPGTEKLSAAETPDEGNG